MTGFLKPHWPAPATVRAFTTTRLGGVSGPPYASLNLGDHVGDDPDAVADNRRQLRQDARLPADPVWLRQVHGIRCVDLVGDKGSDAPLEADAAVTRQLATVCAILTADCLPVLFCNDAGTVVGAAHAGWRGLLNGVIEATVAAMAEAPLHLMAWLGPAIGPAAFEVGSEVREAFVAHHPAATSAFTAIPAKDGKWLCDLYGLARQRLLGAGVRRVYGGERCTWQEKDEFFSYRRDGTTGRMASLIWLEKPEDKS